MNALEICNAIARLPAMSKDALNKVRHLEELSMERPQITLRTHHTIHSGMYTRSIHMPAGALITGALIKIPTTLVINGHVKIYTGGEPLELTGYNVLTASAGRKQVFVAVSDVSLTMMFATNAKSVEEAEREFTDELAPLVSHRSPELNTIIITGE